MVELQNSDIDTECFNCFELVNKFYTLYYHNYLNDNDQDILENICEKCYNSFIRSIKYCCKCNVKITEYKMFSCKDTYSDIFFYDTCDGVICYDDKIKLEIKSLLNYDFNHLTCKQASVDALCNVIDRLHSVEIKLEMLQKKYILLQEHIKCISDGEVKLDT